MQFDCVCPAVSDLALHISAWAAQGIPQLHGFGRVWASARPWLWHKQLAQVTGHTRRCISYGIWVFSETANVLSCHGLMRNCKIHLEYRSRFQQTGATELWRKQYLRRHGLEMVAHWKSFSFAHVLLNCLVMVAVQVDCLVCRPTTASARTLMLLWWVYSRLTYNPCCCSLFYDICYSICLYIVTGQLSELSWLLQVWIQVLPTWQMMGSIAEPCGLC